MKNLLDMVSDSMFSSMSNKMVKFMSDQSVAHRFVAQKAVVYHFEVKQNQVGVDNNQRLADFFEGELKDRVEYLKSKVESLKSNAIKANYRKHIKALETVLKMSNQECQNLLANG